MHGYVSYWFKIDQMYRKFIHALKASGQVTLSPLVETIENLYTNGFVTPLAVQWQGHVDAMDTWSVPDVTPQRQFYDRFQRITSIEVKRFV